MRCAKWLLLLLCVFSARQVCAGDTLTVVGMIDMRWVSSNAETSYLYGGLGPLRFDADNDGFRLGRAMLAGNLRVTDLVTVHAVLDGYGDDPGNPIDLSELYAEIRPFPTNAVRWSARVGAFYMPVSLENRGIGWTPVYSITPSALNTWLGEEFRTIGAECEARWLGASSGYYGDVALVAAAYGWNDPAGVLLATRGFALSDRPSTLFDGYGRPSINFYHEIDHRPGFYTGLSWRHHDMLELRALRYDNRGNPGATTADGEGAWNTHFWSFGGRLEPANHWTLVAQYMDGETTIGADSLGAEQYNMTFHAGFVLGSYAWGRQLLTTRYDDFGTHQYSGFFGPPTDEAGHSWTLAWGYDLTERWQILVEGIRVSSSFPPRLSVGEPLARVDSQLQAAVRYRFRLER
ncbi:MAG: hypothetical protein ACLQJ0_19940 [Steroidobacteraceae bacterium]|jgi:hypothetical protein